MYVCGGGGAETRGSVVAPGTGVRGSFESHDVEMNSGLLEKQQILLILGASPQPPRGSLTGHPGGRQTLGRGWGGWGAKWVALSGSTPTGDRGVPPSLYPSYIAPAPGAVASLQCPFCYGHLSCPQTSQPKGNPRKRQELARYPGQLQAKAGNSSATFTKSPRAPRPCAPGVRPPSS